MKFWRLAVRYDNYSWR